MRICAARVDCLVLRNTLMQNDDLLPTSSDNDDEALPCCGHSPGFLGQISAEDHNE